MIRNDAVCLLAHAYPEKRGERIYLAVSLKIRAHTS